ncbi:MAG: hypothetical protein WAO29_02510 [Candidatus Nanopelagicales bacterium]
MLKNLLKVSLIAGIAAASYFVGTQYNSDSQSISEAVDPQVVETPLESQTQPDPQIDTEIDTSTLTAPSDPQAALAWNALMDPEGEYAAYAMYSAVIVEFGSVEPYVSIREAEGRHIEALIRQLSRYGVVVPENPYLGKVLAPEDLQTAAEAWAIGEIANVELYDKLLAQTSDSNLIKVFTNLRASSNDQHLPMFTAAAKNGGQLTAEQMTQFMSR